MESSSEYRKFDETMKRLIAVTHDQIKTKLEAEKAAKKRKVKMTSASGPLRNFSEIYAEFPHEPDSLQPRIDPPGHHLRPCALRFQAPSSGTRKLARQTFREPF